MKNQRGVTALSLMVAIVIIILIAAFSLLNSRDIVVEANITKVVNEMKILKEAVQQISLDESNMSGIIETNKINNISEYNSKVGGKLENDKEYYYLPYGDKGISDVTIQTLNEALDVRSIENSYIFSIEDIGKVSIYLVDGFRIGDTYYYSYEEISRAYEDVIK